MEYPPAFALADATEPDVAARFEVGVRTACRGLDFLRDELRTPIEYDRTRGSWWLTVHRRHR